PAYRDLSRIGTEDAGAIPCRRSFLKSNIGPNVCRMSSKRKISESFAITKDLQMIETVRIEAPGPGFDRERMAFLGRTKNRAGWGLIQRYEHKRSRRGECPPGCYRLRGALQ